MSHCRHRYKVCGVTVLHCVINISNKYSKHLMIARLFKIEAITIFEYYYGQMSRSIARYCSKNILPLSIEAAIPSSSSMIEIEN